MTDEQADGGGPNPRLLDRDGARAQASTLIGEQLALLAELVDYGTHVYSACVEMMHALPMNTQWAVFKLYHHVLSASDAACEALAAGSSYGAMAHCRAAFEGEAQLAVLFRMPNNAEFERASLFWVAEALKRRVSNLRALDMVDQARAAARRGERPGPTEAERVAAERANQQAEGLHQAMLRDHPEIYQQVLGSRRSWYGHLGWGSSIEQLCMRLDASEPVQDRPPDAPPATFLSVRTTGYNALYRDYSEAMHGTDYYRLMRPAGPRRPDGGTVVRMLSLRDPEELRRLVGHALSPPLAATRGIVGALRPDLREAMVRWYTERVRERYVRFVRPA